MKNENYYEITRKILEDNIIRLMMEKNLTARALSDIYRLDSHRYRPAV